MKKNGLHPVPRQCQFQLEALRSFDSLRKNITCFRLVAYLDSDTCFKSYVVAKLVLVDVIQ